MNWNGFLRCALVSVLAPAAAAQSPNTPLREGDPAPGGDHVTAVTVPLIDDDRTWLALVDTDRANVFQDGLVLRNGAEYLREGTPLVDPAGTELDEFSSLWWSGGKLSAVLRIRFAVGVVADALYHDGLLLALESDRVGMSGVSAAAVWDRFHVVRSTPSHTVFALCEINDPDVPGPREGALVRFVLDDSGTVLAKEIMLVEGQHVAALGESVTLLPTTEGALALNARSDFVTTVQTPSGSAVLMNLDTVLAREGMPSPVAGRNYRLLNSLPRVSIDDLGGHAFVAVLDGDAASDFCIVKDGQKFAQEGELLPAFGTRPLDLAFASPLHLANSGDLFWLARSTGGNDEAFLRNDRVIVQRNKTSIDRHLVTRVELGPQAFNVSPDGRFFFGRVELEGIGDALILVDFGLVVPLPGCHGNTGRLRKAGGDARVGTRLTLELDGGQAPGVVPLLFVGSRASRPGSPCGIRTSAGEVFYDPASVVATLTGAPWNGAPVTIDLDIPASLALVDHEFFVQGAFVNQGSGPARRRLLTNGLRLEIGAP